MGYPTTYGVLCWLVDLWFRYESLNLDLFGDYWGCGWMDYFYDTIRYDTKRIRVREAID